MDYRIWRGQKRYNKENVSAKYWYKYYFKNNRIIYRRNKKVESSLKNKSATFAYFTASTTTQGDDKKTVSGTTKALASATFTYGDTIEEPSEGLYPGYKWVKKLSVKGGGEADSDPIDLVLTIKRTDDTTENNFGSHIKWYLYKANSTSDSVTCTNEKQENTVGTEIQYSYSGSCDHSNATVPTTSKSPSGVASKYEYSGTLTDTTEHVALIEGITYNTEDDYYLVVEYVNDDSQDQNSEQGKTFTVELDVAPQA